MSPGGIVFLMPVMWLCAFVDALVLADILFFHQLVGNGSGATSAIHWQTSTYCGECHTFPDFLYLFQAKVSSPHLYSETCF
jgi:hypothetical protein